MISRGLGQGHMLVLRNSGFLPKNNEREGLLTETNGTKGTVNICQVFLKKSKKQEILRE